MDLSERTPARILDEAREDLNNATTAPDEHRRQQYARSADHAVEIARRVIYQATGGTDIPD